MIRTLSTALFLCLLTFGAQAETTFNQTGAATAQSSTGVTYKRVGNTIYGSDGTVLQRNGDTITDNNGHSWKVKGNQIMGSNGVTYHRDGDKLIGSDGSMCKKVAGATRCD